MSRILDTANGSTSVSMTYEIKDYLEDLFNTDKLDAKKLLLKQEIQSFIDKYGDCLSVEVDVSIDEGYACSEGITEICSENTGARIELSEIPEFLLSKIDETASEYAEENGLESFFGW